MADLRREILPHMPQLRAYACALTRRVDDAEDLLQDTICRALEKAWQFAPGTNLRRWLTVSMRNRWRDTCRNLERRRRNEQLWAILRGPTRDQAQEAHVLLGELPRTLSPAHWEAVLCDGFGLENAQYAERYGLPIGTAKSRIRRAREALAAL